MFDNGYVGSTTFDNKIYYNEMSPDLSGRIPCRYKTSFI
jgi:hypothetical protein